MLEALLFAAEAPMSVDALSRTCPERRAKALLIELAELTSAASISSSAAGAGVSRPHPTFAYILRRDDSAPQTVARRHRNPLRHRLSRARHPRPGRGHTRRIAVAGHARSPDGAGVGAPRRTAGGAGPAAALCDDAAIPRAFRPRVAPRPARSRRTEGRGPPRPHRRRAGVGAGRDGRADTAAR